MKSDDVERFWGHVNKTEGCWEWSKSLNDTGYGKFRIDSKSIRAHRYSYELANGPIPEGLFVCHKCDNRKCVRPDHLFLGTASDNTNDMVSKGRYVGNIHLKNVPHGDTHCHAKLNADKVRQARRMSTEGMSHQHIANLFGVSDATIGDVIARRTWKHVNE